jgi:hypothetical protein
MKEEIECVEGDFNGEVSNPVNEEERFIGTPSGERMVFQDLGSWVCALR